MNGKHSMASFAFAAVLVIVLCLPVPAQPAGPSAFSFCPPAYCRKPWPHVSPVASGCLRDSYRCKPLPLLNAVAPSMCANYLRKPMPACPPRACRCR
jgi:hypothetical protein